MKKLTLKVLPISLWYTMHLLLFIYILTYAFPEFTGAKSVTYPTLAQLLKDILQHLQLPLQSNPVLLTLLVLLALLLIFGVVYGLLLKVIEKGALNELYSRTFSAIKWSAQNFLLSGVFVIAVIQWIALLSPIDDNLYLIAVVVFILLLVFGTALIGILNRERLLSGNMGGWYRVHWPGWKPLIVFLMGSAILLTIDIGIDLISLPLLHIAASTTWYMVDLFLSGVVLSLFLKRQSFGGLVNELRARANLRFLLAWFLLDIRMFLIALWLIPPVLVAGVSSIFIAPQYIQTLSAIGQTPGMLFFMVLSIIDWMQSYWFMLVPSYVIFIFMIRGRFLVLFDELSRDISHPDKELQQSLLTHA